jgi:two-component system, NtrC family, sensor kinase
MRFFHTLSFRVLVGSFVILLTLFGFYSYFAVRFHSEQLMAYVVISANRMSDVIKNSTHYSMLLNRKEDVYQIITTIGKEPGVDGIRIYNKRGEIMFSTNKKEEQTIVDMHTEACFACHDQEKPLESLPISNRTRIYSDLSGHRVLGLINPIRNEPACSDAACHAHPADRTMLGVLDVRMSLRQVDETIAQAQSKMVTYAVLTVLTLALITGWFFFYTVHRPIKRLMIGTEQISSGNLDYQLSNNSRDEIGQFARSFNEMTKSLKKANDENLQWSQTLENKVREKTNELKLIHGQILQIEKMASLGKLSATVAHELNNPLEAILTYAKLIAKRLKRENVLTEQMRKMLEDIEFVAQEALRCGNIVKNLLLFSKKQVGEFGLLPVKQIIEKATRLMQHHFAISNVRFSISYAPDTATLVCDENQIQQALIALFVNAVEAMPDGGTLQVEVSQQGPDGELQIVLTDSGVGISAEDLPHIFEPFFTTKKEAKGVGLGLSVVYGIVERHGGKISVQSELGKGTTFRLVFFPAASNVPKIHIKKNAHPEQQDSDQKV